MKKLFTKDKNNRQKIKYFELKRFVLKQISTNANFIKTMRWNALWKLNNVQKKSSKTILSNRCIKTTNKKRFHKFSIFSRIVFLKLIQSGQISGLKKSYW